MKRPYLLALLLLATACTPLNKSDAPAERRLGPGVIERKEAAVLGSDEEAAGRIAKGLLMAGVVGIVAASAAEAETGRPQGWLYQVRTKSGELLPARSFSTAEVGDCVLVYDFGPGAPTVVERQAPMACAR